MEPKEPTSLESFFLKGLDAINSELFNLNIAKYSCGTFGC